MVSSLAIAPSFFFSALKPSATAPANQRANSKLCGEKNKKGRRPSAPFLLVGKNQL
jgi:hypothetical protein